MSNDTALEITREAGRPVAPHAESAESTRGEPLAFALGYRAGKKSSIVKSVSGALS
jgi:hypothetical protein